jgi:hypothetical protein
MLRHLRTLLVISPMQYAEECCHVLSPVRFFFPGCNNVVILYGSPIE